MNGLKQGDALSLMFFNFVLEYAVRTVQVNQNGFILNGTHNLLVYLMMEAYMLKENTVILYVARLEIGLEENVDKIKYMVVSGDQNVRRSHNIKTFNSSLERVELFNYLGTN
jgi:hypothetical protein